MRAFGRARAARALMRERLDEYATCWFWWLIGNRWIGFRLDMLCSAVVATVSLAAVVLPARGRLSLDATVVGLAVTYSLALSGTFQYMVRRARWPVDLAGVERLLEYGRDIPVEGPTRARAARAAGRRAAVAAARGRARVRRGERALPRGLAGRAARREPGSRPAPSAASSAARARQEHAARCAVSSRRRVRRCRAARRRRSRPARARRRAALGLVPQDPPLPRERAVCLDPFDEFDDMTVRAALDDAQLGGGAAAAVDGAGDALLARAVDEAGANFSQGERQLLSLARAVLRRRAVVAIDEATASVDGATDALVQRVLRTAPAFRDATTLVIAHRLDTIADSDCIAVFSAGELVECDAPAALLKRKGGAYARMWADASGNRANGE